MGVCAWLLAHLKSLVFWVLSARLLLAHRCLRLCSSVTCDQTYHRGVTCKLDDGVGAINRSALTAEQGKQKRAQHPALWYAGVQGGSGGGGEIV